MKSMYFQFINWFEKYVIFAVIGGFVVGIFGAKFFPVVSNVVDSLVNGFMDGYGYIAPLAIFIILTPSLTKMFKTKEMGRFGLYVIRWYAFRKILACLWAVLFMAVLLRLPILPENSASVGDAISQTLNSLGHMALTSPYFWAMYASIFVAIISLRVNIIYKVSNNILNSIESGGRYFIPFMPVFMVAIGAYVFGLPANVAAQVGLEGGQMNVLQNVNIWGLQIDPTVPTGMILIYIVGALLTALACFLWQLVFLFMTARKESRFSVGGYFRNYWIKVYPLLWATSSEALATPLNLYLTKRHAPWVRGNVRRFIIGIGSYMNINGTLINVFVLGVIVLAMLGINVSVVELLLIIPVVFLISYGVPGIPGELVLFAGPMAILLNIPPEIVPLFLAIYIGIQIGLSDSFRTGSNSTDDYIGAVFMNKVYEDKFLSKEERDTMEAA